MTDPPEGQAASIGDRSSRRRDLSRGFRRALGLTTLGTFVPGAGLTRTRSRTLGWLLVVVFLASLAFVGYRAATQGLRSFGLGVVTDSTTLLVMGATFVVGGLIWCVSIIATAVQSRPQKLDRRRTRVLAAFTTFLVISAAKGCVASTTAEACSRRR